MIKNKLFKILSLSLSLSIASMGFAFAEASTKMDEPLSIQITAVDEALYEKQAEIDKLLFEEKAKDLEDKGISIIYTGAAEDFVEIGIIPFTPENADFVSKLINDDNVKVVEGLMASTLEYNPELNEENPDPRVVLTAPELADDSQMVTTTGEDAEVVSAPVDPKAEELADDSKIVSTETEKEKGVSPMVIAAGAIAAIGIGALMFKKKTA